MKQLAPGFRFFPTEEELVAFYLQKKLEGNTPELHRAIPVVDVYEQEPWHLPSLICVRIPIRAFDRRPTIAMTRMTQQIHGDGAATTSHQNTQLVEKTSSFETSYSEGDHVDHLSDQTAEGSTDLQMFEELEPLWDWEQLDWL